ncbi:MAG: hypothetical protein JW957_00380 [Candidatus Omnitrophica bacterium]|nr:hypothetical protein [Candidatus Omnitrophota bacterium]
MRRNATNKDDRRVLRELGTIIRDIAADSINGERKILWKRLNGLKCVRPLIFIFEIPWHEMEYENELTSLCHNSFLKEIEIKMRRTIYQWRHMQGDMVIEGFVASPLAISDTGIGLSENVVTSKTDERSDIVSRHFNIQIRTEENLEKIKKPVVRHNEEESERNFQLLSDIFDGLLPVRKEGVKYTSVAPWDELVRLTGVNEILTDMAVRPNYVHKVISRMTDAYLSHLKQCEQLNLLALNNDNTYLGGGLQYTDELPQKDFNPRHVRPLDMWGRTMSQIFSAVSPAMHDEFALQYELKYLGQFGLTYYGCCEPLHKKIGILRQIPNLRKISMSPWVNTEEGADEIGQDYVYSMKPNPAFLASNIWKPELVRKNLEENLKKTRDCITEVILKDISTVCYQPQRLWEWSRIAAEIVAGYGHS